MNIYFLVEGKRSEMKVYPKWLSYLAPHLSQVESFEKVKQDNYFIFSGEGWPSILNHTINAIEDINTLSSATYDYLILCIDADESTVEDRKNEIISHINKNNVILTNCEIKIIVQNRTIETWFLGNRKLFSKNAKNAIFSEYVKFYNVSKNDPEMMGIHPNFNSISEFHHNYLKRMFEEKNLCYKKRNPKECTEKHYFNQLVKRTDDTTHLETLKDFFDFCRNIRELE